ncbi:excalibur calcium-binding domain-containing protein [Cohnella boryungensis]|uniref:Excalibur calcium-binding domain-containing protein n=1 Tax=Cohnella boryungensis TaxID=768479 RepID=A0ABV8SG19_9BACL
MRILFIVDKPKVLFPQQPDPASPSKDVGPTDEDNVIYPNCAAVREAGKSPLHRSDPGYSKKLDRDGDGLACE